MPYFSAGDDDGAAVAEVECRSAVGRWREEEEERGGRWGGMTLLEEHNRPTVLLLHRVCGRGAAV